MQFHKKLHHNEYRISTWSKQSHQKLMFLLTGTLDVQTEKSRRGRFVLPVPSTVVSQFPLEIWL